MTLQPLTPAMLAHVQEQHAPCPVCQGVVRVARGCPACGDTGRLPAGVQATTAPPAEEG